MKDVLISLISDAINALKSEGVLPDDTNPNILIERTKNPEHGDFASNIALILAKPAKMNPRQLAEKVVASLPASEQITDINIAGPGFINFKLSSDAATAVVGQVLEQKTTFGQGANKGTRINVEFVSANPTGPLHVGHGRGAAFGSGLSNLLEFAGFDVDREYYVNDAGRQMDILATSVFMRYLQALGETLTFPSNAYQGDYIQTIAEDLKNEHGDKFNITAKAFFENVTPDEADGGDKEKHIDDLIANAKSLLGNNYDIFHAKALNEVLNDIKDDLGQFGIQYATWFSEKSLTSSGDVHKALDVLTEKGLTFEQNGALWFRATEFGDDKDRVLVRDNGATTYFASDAAYLLNKFNREYDTAIYVLGADHHGYIPRLKALASAFGLDPERIHIPLVQFATLYQNGKALQMSTRSGEFVTLRDLYTDVGVDAARFFYLMRKNEQHLDFDLDLAKSQSNDNPVYYIQYAHARLCSIFKQLEEKGLAYDQALGLANLAKLSSEQEQALFKALAKFPEMIQSAAKQYEPHQVTYYLRELANLFHSYYNNQQFLIDDDAHRSAILNLCASIQQVLANGLCLLGLTAPKAM